MAWLGWAMLTVVSWGVYGVFLHTGAMGMADPANGRIKAFLFVGVAYFLTAVLAPLAILALNGASWDFPAKGLWWSLIAGIVGAIGALGVLLAVDPWLGLAALATWLAIFALFRISSLSAIIAAVSAPFYDLAMAGPRSLTLAIAIMSVLLLWRHSANIRRLLAGEEGRVGNKPAVAAEPGNDQ